MRRSGIARCAVSLLLAVLAACGTGSDPASESRQASSGAAAAASKSDTAAVSGTVYTADEGSNTLSAVDLATGSVTPVPVTIVPHNVEASAGAPLLLAIGPIGAAHGGHG